MEAYKNLKDNWKKAKVGLPEADDFIENIQKRIAKLKKGQKTTNIVLGITVIIIIAYLAYVVQFGINALNGGLLLMAMVILVRLFVEIRDRRRLSNLNPILNTDEFKDQLQHYYKHRFLVHRWLTPVLFLLYIFGFTLLLPTFKAVFSKGFYIYILVSGFISLAVIAIIIIKQTRKELRELKSLR